MMIELSPEQQQLKELFGMFEEKQETMRKTILYHMVYHEKIGHVVVPHDSDIMEKLKTDEWASTGAYCVVCKRDMGWWCPKSPDHQCHYYKDEFCDYCEMPLERK